MRHRKRGRKLNRNASHRKAMFKNMANSLFEHERIVTTLAKAKELRPLAEKLITIARKGAAATEAAESLKDKAGDHDHQASTLLSDARRHGVDTDQGKEKLEQRRAVLKERYELLSEWRRAIAPALHARRQLISRLGDYHIESDDHETIIQKLMREIGVRYADRPGGYTQIFRLTERRLGDAGQQAIICLLSDETQATKKPKKRAQADPVPTEVSDEEKLEGPSQSEDHSDQSENANLPEQPSGESGDQPGDDASEEKPDDAAVTEEKNK